MLKIETPNNEDKVLLHSCCAPCSSAIIECLLANNIRPTVFYYNPNIYPQAEYDIRKLECYPLCKSPSDLISSMEITTISFGAVPCQGWKMNLNVGVVVCNVLLFACRKQPLCRRAWFHAIHHYPCLFPLEKSRPD